MKPAEVARALSYREFSRLCGLIDEKGPASKAVDIGQGKTTGTAGRLREVKFQVIRIDRKPKRVRVLVDTGKGFGETCWYELAA